MKEKTISLFEQEKIENFQRTRQFMLDNGYQETKIHISTLKLNVMGLTLSLPIALLIYWAYLAVYGQFVWFSKFSLPSLLLLIGFIVAVIVHELIHGLVWSRYCKRKWNAVYFKFVWDYLMPCCICTECIPRYGYSLGLIMPTLLLGVLPCVVSFLIANHYLMLLGLALIICGGGDVYSIWHMRKLQGWLLLDNPADLSCIAFKK